MSRRARAAFGGRRFVLIVAMTFLGLGVAHTVRALATGDVLFTLAVGLGAFATGAAMHYLARDPPTGDTGGGGA